MLRHRSDRRTLVYSLGLFPLPLLLGLIAPEIAGYFVPLALYLSFCAGVLAHYHNHLGVFEDRTLNRLYSVWLSMFYGFPLFSWIPTHNQNHHRHQNGPGDQTSTLRRAPRDNLYELLSYPMRSSRWQARSVWSYLLRLQTTNRPAFRWAVAQAFGVGAFQLASALALTVSHGLGKGLVLYLLLVGLPAALGPWMMMFVNYAQHVGCSYDSPDDHSRNFVGSWENWLVFDAGLHTVHHEHPGVHWSQYRRLHAQRESRISSALNERNILVFVVRRYLLGRA